jgi:hypothetical protein
MEQSGRNQWQSAANGWGRKRLKQAQTVAVVCDQLPRPQNGKDGVSGSSPEEGALRRMFQISAARRSASRCVSWRELARCAPGLRAIQSSPSGTTHLLVTHCIPERL